MIPYDPDRVLADPAIEGMPAGPAKDFLLRLQVAESKPVDATRIASEYHDTFRRLADKFDCELSGEAQVPWDETSDGYRQLVKAVIYNLQLRNVLHMTDRSWGP